MARETNAQLKEKCDQLQKSLDDAKLTIRQLEINIKIMGENAEKNDSNKVVLECQILKKEIADIDSERRQLKFENKRLKKDNEVLKQKVEDLENSVNESHKNTIAVGKMMEESSEFYLKQIQELQEENRKLRSQTELVHNARGAGRKKNDAAWIKKYVEFCSLVKDGKTMADIMGKMQISRSTYFRFMKSYKEDLELDTAIDTAQEEIRKKNKVSKNNK
jgi:chromosome segregation ATPase